MFSICSVSSVGGNITMWALWGVAVQFEFGRRGSWDTVNSVGGRWIELVLWGSQYNVSSVGGPAFYIGIQVNR